MAHDKNSFEFSVFSDKKGAHPPFSLGVDTTALSSSPLLHDPVNLIPDGQTSHQLFDRAPAAVPALALALPVVESAPAAASLGVNIGLNLALVGSLLRHGASKESATDAGHETSATRDRHHGNNMPWLADRSHADPWLAQTNQNSSHMPGASVTESVTTASASHDQHHGNNMPWLADRSYADPWLAQTHQNSSHMPDHGHFRFMHDEKAPDILAQHTAATVLPSTKASDIHSPPAAQAPPSLKDYFKGRPSAYHRPGSEPSDPMLRCSGESGVGKAGERRDKPKFNGDVIRKWCDEQVMESQHPTEQAALNEALKALSGKGKVEKVESQKFKSVWQAVDPLGNVKAQLRQNRDHGGLSMDVYNKAGQDTWHYLFPK